MIEIVKMFAPTFSKFEEAPIILGGTEVGWHSTILDANNNALAGGCSRDRDTARRIAVSEIIERGTFLDLIDKCPKEYLLDEFPTSCGFAAGFENTATKNRALAEAVERWSWSKWIDQKFAITSVSKDKISFSPVSRFFFSQFENVKFFHNFLDVEIDGNLVPVQFAVCLGFKGSGVFPGSRVCTINESPWEHSLVEAWRNILIAEHAKMSIKKLDFYRARIKFFSENKEEAIKQIPIRLQAPWPSPRLRLLRQIPNTPQGTYVWRALCYDYLPWHIGNERRFVY